MDMYLQLFHGQATCVLAGCAECLKPEADYSYPTRLAALNGVQVGVSLLVSASSRICLFERDPLDRTAIESFCLACTNRTRASCNIKSHADL